MTTIGLDVASVDGNKNIDWKAAYAAGGRLAIIRAIYGRPLTKGTTSPFRDPMWEQEAPRARAAGFKVTAYLFVCVPQPGQYTPSPEQQAQAFVDYVKLSPGIDLMPCFDVEEASSLMTADQYYAWILRIAKIFWQYYGTWPGMYTSERVWTEYLKDHVAGELIECPMWITKPWPWAVRTPVHLDGASAYEPTYIPQWGNQCMIYQYQGDALDWPGFSSTVDANRFETTQQGAKGEQVKWIQRRIGTVVDGDFGPKTKTAVQTFQSKHGLITDGIVGLDTFTAMCWVDPPSAIP